MKLSYEELRLANAKSAGRQRRKKQEQKERDSREAARKAAQPKLPPIHWELPPRTGWEGYEGWRTECIDAGHRAGRIPGADQQAERRPLFIGGRRRSEED